MRILKNTVMGIDPIYPLDRLSDISKIMFLDIETTGLSPVNSIVYLIGAAYCSGGTWKTVQFFADSPSEESQIIYSFFNFAAAFDTLITYNGNKFDIPFFEERVNSYDLPYNFTLMRGIDIYKRIKPYKCMFALADLRQKSVEHFMGIDRDDEKSGSELIGLYQAYTENPNEYALNLILQHNFDDICGMLKIIPVLSYSDIANTGIRAD